MHISYFTPFYIAFTTGMGLVAGSIRKEVSILSISNKSLIKYSLLNIFFCDLSYYDL